MDSTCHIWEVNTGKVVKVIDLGVPIRCVSVSEGDKCFVAIAIVGGRQSEEEIRDYVSACGMCRQVLREFVDTSSFYVIMAKSEQDYIVKTLEELLPMSFGPDNLK